MLTKVYSTSLLSDHLYAWSDQCSKRIHRHSAKASQRSCSSTAPAQIDPARLPHRAIQTMWQTGMQMCRRPRTRAQILFVGELSRPEAGDGLRATGGLWRNGKVSRQLSPKPRNPKYDLRDQLRIAAPSRGALKRHHERVPDRRPCVARCAIGRGASRQYARRLARRQPGEFILCGGSR
jgi:hypothetical protein